MTSNTSSLRTEAMVDTAVKMAKEMKPTIMCVFDRGLPGFVARDIAQQPCRLRADARRALASLRAKTLAMTWLMTPHVPRPVPDCVTVALAALPPA